LQALWASYRCLAGSLGKLMIFCNQRLHIICCRLRPQLNKMTYNKCFLFFWNKKKKKEKPQLSRYLFIFKHILPRICFSTWSLLLVLLVLSLFSIHGVFSSHSSHTWLAAVDSQSYSGLPTAATHDLFFSKNPKFWKNIFSSKIFYLFLKKKIYWKNPLFKSETSFFRKFSEKIPYFSYEFFYEYFFVKIKKPLTL